MVVHGGYLFSQAAALITLLFTAPSAGGVRYSVGNSIWSIPPTTNFYNDWVDSQSFYNGDFLYFEFESEMYNVVQVSFTDYRYCESVTIKSIYDDGPALVPLKGEDYYYFISNMLNYCYLGLKFTLYVNGSTAPTPPPATLP